MTLIPQLGKKYRLINAQNYSKGKLNRVVTVHTLEQEENGSYRGFLSCGGNTEDHSYQDEGNWCLFFNDMQDCLAKIEIKLEVGKKYRLTDAGGYGSSFVGKEVVFFGSRLEPERGLEEGFGFLLCGDKELEAHDYIDDDNWCLHFGNLFDRLEEIEEPKEEQKMNLEVGKKYRLTDKYWYGDYVIGKEVVYLGDYDGRADNTDGGHGYLSCGGVKEHHYHKDENHWCLHFSNLHNSLEEIEETEEEYPMRREMTIKKKKDGTFTVRMSREELLFIATVCGWVGGEPQGSRRHTTKFYMLADDYLDEKEKDAEIEKFEGNTRGIYVKDGE